MYDVVTFGNAMTDVFLSIHNASEHCRISEPEHELCIRFGEKIMLDRCTFQLGGNACNVAVGMSRLGFRTAIIAELGGDEFAHKIRAGLALEGVSTEYLRQTDSASSLSIALSFRGDRTLFVEHVERQHAFAYDGMATRWLYVTSLGAEWHRAYADIHAHARQRGIRVAFNPGTPQLHAGISSFAPMLELCDVLFVNKEEAELLLGDQSGSNTLESLLLRVQALGPRTVVITDAENGSAAIDQGGRVYAQGCVPAAIVERTGAGDGFATGYLAATLLEHDVQTALMWGTVNAASVIGQIGTQPGLLQRAEIQQRVAQARVVEPISR